MCWTRSRGSADGETGCWITFGTAAGTGVLDTGLPPSNAPRPRPRAGFAMGPECRSAGSLSICRPRRIFGGMSLKNLKVAALIYQFQGREFDAHYLGFFECFNRQEFFEAHEVLEEL